MSGASAASTRPPGRPLILVAEDDPDVLRMLETILRTIGEVTTARDGQEAFELASAGPTPDLIVTDIMMPRMDGLALARTLKADARLSRVPVVMLTARTGPRDVIAGINAGARFYVTKPFKTDELLSKVRKALGHK
ncbi:MAG: response regulator [Sandaracinaceae bacterium]|nr:response regulator [Sandaracinaceae bacterium]MCC6873292.1 response regulator [Sandaracinaceae bacterium]